MTSKSMVEAREDGSKSTGVSTVDLMFMSTSLELWQKSELNHKIRQSTVHQNTKAVVRGTIFKGHHIK